MRPTLILAGALLLAQPVASPAQTTWDMPTEYPQNTMPGLGVTTFAGALDPGPSVPRFSTPSGPENNKQSGTARSERRRSMRSTAPAADVGLSG